MLFLNCQKLTFRKADIIYSDYICNNNFLNFICLCEVGFRDSQIGSINFPGFENTTQFSRKIFKLGGVGIWSRVGLCCEPLDLDSFCIEKDVEVCGVLWKVKRGTSIALLSCYRSPCGKLDVFFQKVYAILSFLYKPGLTFIIGGDFNFDPVRDKQAYKSLEDILLPFNLRNIVTKPTRGQYILDHIYTNLECNDNYDSVSNTISDHNTLIYKPEIKCVLNHSVNRYFRSFGSESVCAFSAYLNEESWSGVYVRDDLDGAFESFYSVFMFYFDLCFPLKKKYEGGFNEKRWVTNEIKMSSVRLRELYNLQERNGMMIGVYRSAKREHANLISRTKKDTIKVKYLQVVIPQRRHGALLMN